MSAERDGRERARTSLRRWPSVVVGLLASACAPSLMRLPAATGIPAADLSPVVDEATRECRAVTTYSAELTVRGTIGGRRIPRVRLLIGLAAPGSAYLEAVAGVGEPLFIYAAHEDEATLLLPRDDRALAGGDPRAVLEALTGIPLGAADLRATVTGCLTGDVAAGVQVGDDWRRAAVGLSVFYLRRPGRTAAWRVVAALHEEGARQAWRAEYHAFVGGLPSEIRLISRDVERFNLRLALADIEINQPLGPEVFSVAIPPAMRPISLDELRRSGPLSGDADGR